MPLVRISLRRRKQPQFGRQIGDVVYRTMMDVLGVPARDNFQIITEHEEEGLVYDGEYLGIRRTDGIVIIQITLNEGRTVQLKQKFYAALAERLEQLGVRRGDVFINLVEVKKENWSFGDGIAQYAESV
jgi:phenylpyruvate tautomerase PptA (4-oxalocrotonate tautomerase family)